LSSLTAFLTAAKRPRTALAKAIRTLVAGSLCNVGIDWVDFYAITIASQPDCMTNVLSNR
jgi:hypothetical protein